MAQGVHGSNRASLALTNSVDEVGRLIQQCEMDIREQRVWYGSRLASTEEGYQRAEAAVFDAYEQMAADDVASANERWGHAFKGLAAIRSELNRLWAELDKPAPDFSVFLETASV
jgi:hypothetical protein